MPSQHTKSFPLLHAKSGWQGNSLSKNEIPSLVSDTDPNSGVVVHLITKSCIHIALQETIWRFLPLHHMRPCINTNPLHCMVLHIKLGVVDGHTPQQQMSCVVSILFSQSLLFWLVHGLHNVMTKATVCSSVKFWIMRKKSSLNPSQASIYGSKNSQRRISFQHATALEQVSRMCQLVSNPLHSKRITKGNQHPCLAFYLVMVKQ